MRTIVIGDIHGSYQSLQKGLSKINFNIETDRLIGLGDYVDGWSESVEVIRLLIEIQSKSQFDNIFILGNHDSMLLELLNRDFDRFRNEEYIRAEYSHWIDQDGESTYRSFLKLNDSEIKILKTQFLDLLKPYHIEDNKLFVHAGFDPNIGFAESLRNDPESLQWNRSLFKKCLLYKELNDAHMFDDFDKIYIGHTPTIAFDITEPSKLGNVINLDQGCKVNGKLTLWDDNTDTFIQTEEIKTN